jgi:hypothetical protein
MNRLCTASVIAAVVVTALLTPALAAPPTVVPSPGYDARLQESRKATTHPIVVDPAMPTAPAVRRHHAKRKQ